MHLCWGNYEGPHHHDVPLADIIDIVLRGPARRRISFEAANPRHAHEWKVFEHVKLPEGKMHHPGRDRLDDELHRASRARRASASSATRGSSAARTSSPAPTAASAPGSGQAAVDPGRRLGEARQPGGGRAARLAVVTGKP